MNLDHLNYFKTLVETKSRTKAADELAITPSTLSLAISKLEQEVGVPLLEKTRGTVELTSDGKLFYEYVATSIRFLDGGLRILREKNGGGFAKHEINIGTVYSAQDKNWSRIISRYRQQTHGEVQINVKQSTTPWLIRNIKKGTIDVAFAGTMEPDVEIQSDPCWTQEAVLVVNRLHPFAGREEISLAELTGHYLVSYNLTGSLGRELTELVKGHDLTIDYLYTDEITLASIVAGNPDIMAISCRSWLLDSYGDEITLVKISEAPTDFHQIYLLSKGHIEQPHIIATFIDVVEKYCAEPKG